MSDVNIRTLGPSEAKLLNKLAATGQYIFDTEDARAVLDSDQVNISKLLYRLARKRWLFRLEKGKYLILPLEAGMEGRYTVHEFIIAAHLIGEPYAIAYVSALSFHGLTDQVASTVFVASTKRRQDVTIEELDLHYRFIALDQTKFFGIEKVLIDEESVAITDPTKTIIDGLDHPDYCGGIAQMAKALWRYRQSEAADLEKMTAYAARLGNRTVFKRLGYLAEVLGLDVGNYPVHWREAISSGMSLLDPRYGKRGAYNTTWNLRLNVNEHQLTEWREH
jgi:predicted transcriptional regulator of viral defense system